MVRLRRIARLIAALAVCVTAGCRSSSSGFVAHQPTPPGALPEVQSEPLPAPPTGDGAVRQAQYQASAEEQSAEPLALPEVAGEPLNPNAADPAKTEGATPPGAATEPLPGPPVAEELDPGLPASLSDPSLAPPTLATVVASTRNFFPLVQEAAAGRIVASGEAISAAGAFDRKFNGYSNAQPLDFFENHWHSYTVKRDTLWGGQVGAGYKLGRGSFEPWYLERETNDLGEFSVNVSAPLNRRDRAIDANRAGLWRAQLERGRVEPEIRAMLIKAVREGSVAYWNWVAADAQVRVAEDILKLGLDRVKFLELQVKLKDKARIDLQDNRRIIVSRQAKLIDAQRKRQQAAIKLSLYLRDQSGSPLLVDPASAPESFPAVQQVDEQAVEGDIAVARASRPELAELGVIRRQLLVDLRQARNETLVDVDGGIFLGQDVGNPTSSDNKSEFEIEATLLIEVPLERRKALGKVRQIRGKLAKLAAKQQFAYEKIGGEVMIARAALSAAARRVEQTTEGVELARVMREAEDEKLREGLEGSTLLTLNLREQQAADAASELINAQLDYFIALADYSAALGLDDALVAADDVPGPAQLQQPINVE